MSKAKSGFKVTNQTLTAAEATAEIALNVKDKIFLGNINVTLVDTARILPDPNNPRNLEITQEEILSELNYNNPEYNLAKQRISSLRKIVELEQLEKLANSIKQNGLLNAIVTYKEGSHLYIVTGERRYLSCLILGYISIPTKILNKKPNDFQLRIIQWAENNDREDLTAWDRLENVRSITEAYAQENDDPISARKLADIINISKTQAARYLQLINEPYDSQLIENLKQNKIKSLKIAVFLTAIQDSMIKDILITLASDGIPLTDLQKKLEDLQNNKIQPPQAKSVKLKFLAPKKTRTAGFILQNLINLKELVMYKDKFSNINWDHPEEINKAWKKIIKILETNFIEESK